MIDPFTGLPYDALVAFGFAYLIIATPIVATLIVIYARVRAERNRNRAAQRARRQVGSYDFRDTAHAKALHGDYRGATAILIIHDEITIPDEASGDVR